MVFSDLFFLFVFMPAFFACYALAAFIDSRIFTKNDSKSFKCKNYMLVAFSLIFYAWGEPVYVFLLLVSVFINYVAGLFVDKYEGANRRLALTAGIVCNILIISTFKYLGFFAATLADMGINVAVPKIALPIGISFYTFQSISYLIDIYRKESMVQKRFVNLLLYISMFPQLIAGPIVRYGTVAKEITDRHVSVKDFSDGLYRFFIGLGKKVILANQLSEISDQFLAGDISNLTTAGSWIGIIAFSLQIYFDFSGYSDMAIGLGRCLGFHFPENFNHPYCCKSITEFWRRWHISLGSFFRDYVYIPMGGNRRHQPINILTVWFLTGMWHGASWSFIIWGVYFGAIVMIEKYTILRHIERIPAFLLHIYSMILVVVGWGIFYFDDFGRMQQFFHSFSGHSWNGFDIIAQSTLTDNFWLWIVAIAFCLPLRGSAATCVEKLCGNAAKLKNGIFFTARMAITLVLFVCSVALLVGATNNAFIYTRF